jgi:hypothetical protein
LWLRWRLRRWLWWRLLCPGYSPRCTAINPITRDTRTMRFFERNGQ